MRAVLRGTLAVGILTGIALGQRSSDPVRPCRVALDTTGWKRIHQSATGVDLAYPSAYERKEWSNVSPGAALRVASLWRDGRPVNHVDVEIQAIGHRFSADTGWKGASCALATRSGRAPARLSTFPRQPINGKAMTPLLQVEVVLQIPHDTLALVFRATATDSLIQKEQLQIASSLWLFRVQERPK